MMFETILGWFRKKEEDGIERRERLIRECHSTMTSLLAEKASYRLTCKNVDDVFFDDIKIRYKRLEKEVDELRDEIDCEVLAKLDTFPLCTQCTIDYISKYLGVYGLESLMIETVCVGETSVYNGDERITEQRFLVSDREIEADWLEVGYKKHAMYRMKLPNWRFVEASKDSTFYVEKIEERV